MANPKPKPFKPKSKTGADLKKADDYIEKKYPSIAKSSLYKDLKENVKSVASYLGYKKGGAVKKVPKGYHIMPNGKIMKNSAHKKKK